MKPIRVLIADDHTLLRAGLRNLLEELDGLEVVGDAADGQRALELVEALRPDILMTDISMPILDGLALTAAVTGLGSPTRVLILSMHTDWEYADKALRAGAAGYVTKDAGTTEIEMAVRAVGRGESYLSPAISKHIVAGYTRLALSQATEYDPITARQREILKLIAEGLTTKAIASRLDISAKTVDTHRVHLMDRLKIHDIAGLVRYAIRIGLIDQDT